MNSSKGIIDKILGDSQAIAQDNFAQANLKAEEILARADKLAAVDLCNAKNQLESDKKNIIDRRVTVANLDVKKIILQAKKSGVDNAFKLCLKSIKKDKKAYQKLISAMIKSNAKDNDIVLISKCDGDIITAAFISDIAKELNINLKLSDTFGDFEGGIMLCSANYDKNLTLEVEFENMREANESKFVELLYGEK